MYVCFNNCLFIFHMKLNKIKNTEVTDRHLLLLNSTYNNKNINKFPEKLFCIFIRPLYAFSSNIPVCMLTIELVIKLIVSCVAEYEYDDDDVVPIFYKAI